MRSSYIQGYNVAGRFCRALNYLGASRSTMYLCPLWVLKATLRICACRTKPRAESGRCEIMPTRAKTQTLSRAMSRSSVTSSQHLCHKRHTVRVLAIIGVLSKLTKIPSQEMLQPTPPAYPCKKKTHPS